MGTPFERRHACLLVARLARQPLQPVLELDAQGAAGGQRKHPDFLFRDTMGNEFVVEVTRLLSPELLRAHEFARNTIAGVLSPGLRGTFLLLIRFDQLTAEGIPKAVAKRIVIDVQARLSSGPLPDRFEPLPGYEIHKVHNTGAWLEPWMLAEDLPYDLSFADPRARALQRHFELLVEEADEKFEGYSGRKVLLVDFSQTGLDVDFHAMSIGGNEPLMARWVAALPKLWSNVEEIYLEPGVRVWVPPPQETAESGQHLKIRAGTIYTDQPRGFYIRLRPPPLILV